MLHPCFFQPGDGGQSSGRSRAVSEARSTTVNAFRASSRGLSAHDRRRIASRSQFFSTTMRPSILEMRARAAVPGRPFHLRAKEQFGLLVVDYLRWPGGTIRTTRVTRRSRDPRGLRRGKELHRPCWRFSQLNRAVDSRPPSAPSLGPRESAPSSRCRRICSLPRGALLPSTRRRRTARSWITRRDHPRQRARPDRHHPPYLPDHQRARKLLNGRDHGLRPRAATSTCP